MLKIRDDLDLKELEKFGFEYEEEDGEKYWCKYLPDNQHKLFIYEDDREIKQGRFTLIFGYDEVELEEKWIQDLIKANLVEEPIDCVKIIKDYCKENYNKCENCEIYHICEKYFVREPRKWRSE